MKAMDLSNRQTVTRKLYYEDSHLNRCKAVVLEVLDGKKGTEILLDQTVFFPEGGGQASDLGTIQDLTVLHVSEKNGLIYHLLDTDIDPSRIPAEGDEVECSIDWNRRFAHMQGHSGEHIVSGLIQKLYGFENVGFHLGNDEITLDLNGVITREKMLELEEKANEIIWANVPVTAEFPSSEELINLQYRSKLEMTENVRIVSVGENGCFDRCACCAPHVSFTGEIGQIRLLRVQSYKGGVRITMLAGRKAMEYGRMIQNQMDLMALDFSTKDSLVLDSVHRLQAEKQALSDERISLLHQVLQNKAEKIECCNRTLCLFEELQGEDLRFYGNLMTQRNQGITAIFGNNGNYLLIAPVDSGLDVRPLQKKLNEKLGAKGGGKPFMVTGRTTAEPGEIKKFFREIESDSL